MPQTHNSNDAMSAFSLESSLFFWNDRTQTPQLGGDENPLVDEPSHASNLCIDHSRSHSSNLEPPHVPSIAALKIGAGESTDFSFPINATAQPVVAHYNLTNTLAQWETLDSMDLEPRPLGLLPHEASSMLLSESSMAAGASNVARSPPWCRAMLSGSQITPLDVENRSSSGSSSDEEEPRWYKSHQT
jgi:hypothetical protein